MDTYPHNPNQDPQTLVNQIVAGFDNLLRTQDTLTLVDVSDAIDPDSGVSAEAQIAALTTEGLDALTRVTLSRVGQTYHSEYVEPGALRVVDTLSLQDGVLVGYASNTEFDTSISAAPDVRGALGVLAAEIMAPAISDESEPLPDAQADVQDEPVADAFPAHGLTVLRSRLAEWYGDFSDGYLRDRTLVTAQIAQTQHHIDQALRDLLGEA